MYICFVIFNTLKNKIYSILLIIAFVAVILQPAIPFVQYYFAANQQNIAQTDTQCNCECNDQETAKMPSNGDAFLRALLKRVCKDQKKKSPQIPTVTISTFVKTLYTNRVPVYTCPDHNFNKISDFIILPPVSSYHQELFRPPQYI
jgi:hypothetical protein